MAAKTKIDAKEIKEIFDTLQEGEHIPVNPVVVYYPETDEITLESDLYDYTDDMIRCEEEHFCDYLYECNGVLDNDNEIGHMINILFAREG